VTGPSSAARTTPLSLLEYAASDAEDRPKVTRRELEVLELVSEGLSTREISRRLWITEETVKTHVRRMHNRLAARTRAHAVAIAFRKGILR
jgi:DNA-binding CsgD family transcriptional regulator